jgi:hypothetical protein
MNILKPLWLLNFVLGLAALLLFVSDGQARDLVTATVESIILGWLYEPTWRKR